MHEVIDVIRRRYIVELLWDLHYYITHNEAGNIENLLIDRSELRDIASELEDAMDGLDR